MEHQDGWRVYKGIVVYVVREYDDDYHRIAVATLTGLVEGDVPKDCTTGCVVEYESDSLRSALPNKIKFENPSFCNLKVTPVFGTIVITYDFHMSKDIQCTKDPIYLDLPILNTVFVPKTSDFKFGEDIKLIVQYSNIDALSSENVFFVALGWIDRQGKWMRFKLDRFGESHESFAYEVYTEYCQQNKQKRTVLPMGNPCVNSKAGPSGFRQNNPDLPQSSKTANISSALPRPSDDSEFDMDFDENKRDETKFYAAANEKEADDDEEDMKAYLDSIQENVPKKAEEKKKPAVTPEHLQIKSELAQRTHDALIKGADQSESIIPRATRVLESIGHTDSTPEPLQPKANTSTSHLRQNVQRTEIPTGTRGTTIPTAAERRGQISAPVFENERTAYTVIPPRSAKMGPASKRQTNPEKPPQEEVYCPEPKHEEDDEDLDELLQSEPPEEYLQSNPDPIVEEPQSPALSIEIIGDSDINQENVYESSGNQTLRNGRENRLPRETSTRRDNTRQPFANQPRSSANQYQHNRLNNLYDPPVNENRGQGYSKRNQDYQPESFNQGRNSNNYPQNAYNDQENANWNSDYPSDGSRRGNRPQQSNYRDQQRFGGDYGQSYSNANNFYPNDELNYQRYNHQSENDNFGSGQPSQYYPSQQSQNDYNHINYRHQGRTTYTQPQSWERNDEFNYPQQNYNSRVNQGGAGHWHGQGSSGYPPQSQRNANFNTREQDFDDGTQRFNSNQPPRYEPREQSWEEYNQEEVQQKPSIRDELMKVLDGYSKDDLKSFVVENLCQSYAKSNHILSIEASSSFHQQNTEPRPQPSQRTAQDHQPEFEERYPSKPRSRQYEESSPRSQTWRENRQHEENSPRPQQPREMPQKRQSPTVSFFNNQQRRPRPSGEFEQKPVVRPSNQHAQQRGSGATSFQEYQRLMNKTKDPVAAQQTSPKMNERRDRSEKLESDESAESGADKKGRKKELYSKITQPILQPVNHRRDLRNEKEKPTAETGVEENSDHAHVRRPPTAHKEGFTNYKFSNDSDISTDEEDNDSGEDAYAPVKPVLETTSNSIYRSANSSSQQPQSSGVIADAEGEDKKKPAVLQHRTKAKPFGSDESGSDNSDSDDVLSVFKHKRTSRK